MEYTSSTSNSYTCNIFNIVNRPIKHIIGALASLISAIAREALHFLRCDYFQTTDSKVNNNERKIDFLEGREKEIDIQSENENEENLSNHQPKSLDIVETYKTTNTWYCLRGLSTKENHQEYELSKITREKGFKDRSVSPGGYVSPFEPQGFILPVAETDVAECVIYDGEDSLMKAIGTNQCTGYGKRKYTFFDKKHPEVIDQRRNSNPFFPSFEKFFKYKEKQIVEGYYNRGDSVRWNYACGGDEFITTVDKAKIKGIFFSDTSSKKEAVSLRAKYKGRTGIDLPIYKYTVTHFKYKTRLNEISTTV